MCTWSGHSTDGLSPSARGAILAMAELNHLYKLPRFRGQGFDADLNLEILCRFRRLQERLVAIDIFLENERMRSWCRS